MNKKDWIKAGRITGRVREYAKKKLREGVRILDYAEEIEKRIKDEGAGMAFPPNISINEYAAHDTASYEDARVFRKGMVVKVDLGAEINGAIGDSAFTKEIKTNKYKKLIKCSKEALNNSIGIIKPGVKIREIGRIISETIKSYDYHPIINLGGHGLEKYTQHSGLFIPNYDNGNNRELEKGQVIAIEPFATTGKGRVINSNKVKIYNLVKSRPVRSGNARKILKHIVNNYKTLPFTKRWLHKEFSKSEIIFGLRELVKKKIIHEYSLLKEESDGIVSQFEHTIIIEDEPVITTKI